MNSIKKPLNPCAKNFILKCKSSKDFKQNYSNFSDIENNLSVTGPGTSLENSKTANISNDPSDISAEYALRVLRSINANRVIIAHININSIRNKFEMLSTLVMGKIDILLISEVKIDCSFPDAQFKMPGFSTPYRLDRNQFGGGLLLYVREDIPSKQLLCESNEDSECLSIEINIHNKKWLIFGTYNPNKSQIRNHLKILSEKIDQFSPFYDNWILMGDFNSETCEEDMHDFCEVYNLKNLVKEPTCFKNPLNPSCIDLILTNRYRYFQHTKVVETGLSDFHKLTVTVLKTCFKKRQPKIISYREYKNFSHENFRFQLESILLGYDLNTLPNDDFISIFEKIFDKHAPIKFKYIRANESLFMTKELRKAIMLRSKLRNQMNKNHTLLTKKSL